ncbi:hypothetical protein [Paraburkholderia humisilvae]|uniref:Glycine zipper domain-containing protein n=1 Tax=Paraburkholderia humisilvae TaxID=627669 RepID=A0A6J5F301_9BURK|nr:hypothetical protein [Paraburkholderia humisilvae]CAB3773210.1 hypothetical protein LMG29542_07149 [Paraburkholderia humisilvae]
MMNLGLLRQTNVDDSQRASNGDSLSSGLERTLGKLADSLGAPAGGLVGAAVGGPLGGLLGTAVGGLTGGLVNEMVGGGAG